MREEQTQTVLNLINKHLFVRQQEFERELRSAFPDRAVEIKREQYEVYVKVGTTTFRVVILPPIVKEPVT